jgi:hypothetical protein
MTVMAKAILGCAIISTLWTQAPAAEDGWQERVNEEGRKVQSLQISAPSMTEEDQYGYVMPDRYRCDSCKVVVHHLNEALTKRKLKNRQLRESELDEIFEETCKSAFKGYGITLVDGENALSGPALERAGVAPGSGAIQMGGETWEKRLGEICRKFVYDKVGEDELYRHFHAGGKISEELCTSHSRDCTVSGGKALRKVETTQKKAKPEKKTKSAPAPAPAQKEVQKGGGAQKQSKKEVSRQAREQKLKKDIETARQKHAVSEGDAGSVAADDRVDAETFFKQLAVEYNLPAEDYTRDRTVKEWEQFLMRMAGRIYERRATGTTVQV